MFPPASEEMVAAGYRDFADRWNPILDVFDECGVRFAHEVHPSEIAYDYWTTVATMEAIGHREAFGLNWDPQPLRLAGPRPGRVPLGLQGPDLPRRLQGREAPGRQRPQRPARLAPAVGRPAPRLGLRLHRPRRRAVGAVLPDAQHHRLRRPDLGRVGGRRHGPPGRRAGGAGVRPPARLRRPRRRPSTRRSRPRSNSVVPGRPARRPWVTSTSTTSNTDLALRDSIPKRRARGSPRRVRRWALPPCPAAVDRRVVG